jgi:ParB family chromosome partitioning protein
MHQVAISSSRQVPINALTAGPNRWRGANPETDDLQESLTRSPMLAPLVVRPVPGKRNRWEVVAGHRRLAAARSRGWSHVEVRIVAADDELAEMLSLEENIRRRALKNEPKAMARLLDLYSKIYPSTVGRPRKDRTQYKRISAVEALAKASGRSVRMVHRLAAVGRADPAVRALHADGKVDLREAERLAALPRSQQRRQLKLLDVPKTNEQTRALDALRYALKSFMKVKPKGKDRKDALLLVRAIERVLR